MDPSQLETAASAGVLFHRGKLRPASFSTHSPPFSSRLLLSRWIFDPFLCLAFVLLMFFPQTLILQLIFSIFLLLPLCVQTGGSNLHLHDKHKLDIFSEVWEDNKRKRDLFSLDQNHKAHRRFEMRFWFIYNCIQSSLTGFKMFFWHVCDITHTKARVCTDSWCLDKCGVCLSSHCYISILPTCCWSVITDWQPVWHVSFDSIKTKD